ncbi:TetR/AcrR family transcriptional regulator C-terminal domain-containing protein [Streptomyces xanthophaeus]|uniref:TetR/AcrR family transcriptional regulator C-terminal domain-containing protein n=1 Tax=Streptomyces xanthophaeus TaxID=67385 RepID=UPI0004CDA4C3|nr:TetR/AcrR family transcriptional regulator C-terminal domain-containing protein [Streptomyces xanthophaeus]
MASDPKADPIPSIWARPKAAPARPALSRSVIVSEAVLMLDAEGVEAVSMRKLGARLNAGATSLYRHVALKSELMELAVDEALGEVTHPPADHPDWRAALTEFAGSFRATALRHPWLCALLGQEGLAYLGPNLSHMNERLFALFSTAGFPDPNGAINAVYSYCIGMVSTESAWLNTVTRSGQSEAEFLARLHPDTSTTVPDASDAVAIRDNSFTSGLDIVLDGLAFQLNR